MLDLTSEEYRADFMKEAITKYPFFVRLDMTIDEYFEEFNYFLHEVYYLHKNMEEYTPLYKQRKIGDMNG